MKRALLFGSSVLLLACGPLLGQQPSGTATRDIRALYQGYMEAFNKKDVAKAQGGTLPKSEELPNEPVSRLRDEWRLLG
jgi:hypothetical protein